MRMVLVLFASLMLAVPAYANGGGEGENTGCNGEGNPNSPCEGGGGGGGEGGGGGGGSGGAGGSSSIDIGDVTVTTGDSTSTSNASATGGSVYIGGGEEGEGALNSNAENNVDIENNSEGGSATIEEGAIVVETNVTIEGNGESIPTANNQTVEGDSLVVEGDTTTYQAAAIPVNSAPPSFSAICSSGGAGSGKSFSLSLAVTNDVCQALMVADAYMAMGDVEEAMKWVNAAARHAKWKGGMGYFRHIVTLGIM